MAINHYIIGLEIEYQKKMAAVFIVWFNQSIFKSCDINGWFKLKMTIKNWTCPVLGSPLYFR
jgi:hypothetical protein